MFILRASLKRTARQNFIQIAPFEFEPAIEPPQQHSISMFNELTSNMYNPKYEYSKTTVIKRLLSGTFVHFNKHNSRFRGAFTIICHSHLEVHIFNDAKYMGMRYSSRVRQSNECRM